MFAVTLLLHLTSIPRKCIIKELTDEVLRETEKYKYDLQCVKDVCGESELRLMNEQEIYAVYDKCILTNYPATECYKVEI